jgi:DNA-directed RNA polymerase subunit RPC12/RpoP
MVHRDCATCQRPTNQEELTGDRGQQLPDRVIYVCDTCGYVEVVARQRAIHARSAAG